MLWITPQISPDSGAFRELRNTDFLIKDKNDRFAIREWWNGNYVGVSVKYTICIRENARMRLYEK